jgi:hypothetical protein
VRELVPAHRLAHGASAKRSSETAYHLATDSPSAARCGRLRPRTTSVPEGPRSTPTTMARCAVSTSATALFVTQTVLDPRNANSPGRVRNHASETRTRYRSPLRASAVLEMAVDGSRSQAGAPPTPSAPRSDRRFARPPPRRPHCPLHAWSPRLLSRVRVAATHRSNNRSARGVPRPTRWLARHGGAGGLPQRSGRKVSPGGDRGLSGPSGPSRGAGGNRTTLHESSPALVSAGFRVSVVDRE